jgi:hypothetical protein
VVSLDQVGDDPVDLAQADDVTAAASSVAADTV